jgi:hypothetical protein
MEGFSPARGLLILAFGALGQKRGFFAPDAKKSSLSAFFHHASHKFLRIGVTDDFHWMVRVCRLGAPRNPA